MSESIDLSAIKARCERAHPGPWDWTQDDYVPEDSRQAMVCWYEPEDGGGRGVIATEIGRYLSDGYPTAEFIAHSITDIPLLLAEVERLRSQNAECGRGFNKLVAEIAALQGRVAERDRMIASLQRKAP